MSDKRTLPLVTFYLTERCNSRCITCDYWRHGRKDATLESVARVLPDLRRLGTRVALLSGGEPLLNFGLIRYIVERASELNREHGKSLQFVIATNLSRLSPLEFGLRRSSIVSTM